MVERAEPANTTGMEGEVGMQGKVGRGSRIGMQGEVGSALSTTYWANVINTYITWSV